MKAYKVFNPDWTCRGFQYEIGKSYEIEGNPVLCEKGFHACEKVADCFSYYSFDTDNKVAEVELDGIVLGIGEDKQCASKITIVKEISWQDMIVIANEGKGNSGIKNTGDCNTGNWNTGSRNTGDCNTGNWNTGSRNTGNWNTGDWNTGYMNTETPLVRMFNKETDKKFGEIDFPLILYFDTTVWVSHDTATYEEKKEHKQEIEVCGGFLKEIPYNEAFKRSWENGSEEDKAAVKNLPNFDADIFYEISGIRV